MTSLTLDAKRRLIGTAQSARAIGPWRLGILAGLVALSSISTEARDIVLTSLSDAFLQVSVFVAGTLAIGYGLERLFKFDLGEQLRGARGWQVPIAALLGALPGCGGAIIVMTQYASGNIGFASVVAVLTATMGDAAFLLLSQRPLHGLAVFGMGLGVGIISGYVVQAIHKPGFLRMSNTGAEYSATVPTQETGARSLRRLWLILVVPGLAFGGIIAFQVNPDALFGAWGEAARPVVWWGAMGALIAVGMWSLFPSMHSMCFASGYSRTAGVSGPPQRSLLGGQSWLARVIADTNFVTVWVVAAYLLYEFGVYFSGIDLKAWFSVWAPLVPLMGVLVGFLPGCGPQIVVTALFLNGVIPLSAQLGNAISNDGDALFPAMAVSARATIVATLYTSVPAMMIAYGYYYWFE